MFWFVEKIDNLGFFRHTSFFAYFIAQIRSVEFGGLHSYLKSEHTYSSKYLTLYTLISWKIVSLKYFGFQICLNQFHKSILDSDVTNSDLTMIIHVA